MKFGSLIKYSLYLLIMILLIFLILTIYIYFFSSSAKIEIAYNFIIPVCLFVASLLYARSTKEKGLIMGIEMWIVYFVIVLLLKMVLKIPTEISIIKHLLYLPISIFGGIIGVNAKK
ncbi:MAG: TIGR04086 family membrane protein [Tissierellia bacterium]|nr:TIGR04086 family membrane protein [Tissierellia bacterium]MDD4779237.1 TIGR04086 family membrane protein [Tissierellia bacterium]